MTESHILVVDDDQSRINWRRGSRSVGDTLCH